MPVEDVPRVAVPFRRGLIALDHDITLVRGETEMKVLLSDVRVPFVVEVLVGVKVRLDVEACLGVKAPFDGEVLPVVKAR